MGQMIIEEESKDSVCSFLELFRIAKPCISTETYKAENPKKFTGSKIGAIFCQIASRVTTKNLKIGQRGLFELGPFFSLFS